MGISSKYVLDKLILPGGIVLAELNQLEMSSGVEQLIERGAGVAHPQFASVSRVQPNITFECHNIATLLAATGMTAMSLAGANTDLFFRKVTANNVRELYATTVHKRFRMTTGMLCWSQIRASQGQTAVASCRIIAGYDGTNLPLVETTGLAISGVHSGNEQFTLGPVKVGSQLFRGVTEMTIDSGLSFMIDSADGDVYPTFIAIEEGSPSIMFSGPDMEQFEDWEFGANVGGTVIAYLRKKSTLGNIANASAQHISFTSAANPQLILERGSGGGNQGAISAVKVTAVSNTEGTWPWTVSTATAIT